MLEWQIFWETLSKWPFFIEYINSLPHILRQLFYISLFILVIYVITKYKGSLLKISQYFNVLLIALIIYQIFAIFFQNTTKITLADKAEIIDNKQKKANNHLPDIYYIILDAYTSNQSLKDYWDYKNDEMADFLGGKGFCIATDSRTNYNLTLYSICSSLNMSYLTNVPQKKTEALARIKNLSNLIEESQVVKILLKYGYQITNYSFKDLPETPRYYDDFFYLKKGNLFNGTAFAMIAYKMNIKWMQDENRVNLFSLKTINPKILDNLKRKNIDNEKPLFVFAHIMMPHDPYLFDEYGRTLEDDSVFIAPLKNRYLGQLKYANKLVMNSINSIFKNNPITPPVIIIQGDHGYRYLPGKNLKESLSIFNAYYFPDHDYSKIYNSISPVNTFRILFNKYLNAGLPILNDTSYNVFIH